MEFEGYAIYALCSKLYFVEGVEKPLDPKKEEEKAKNAADPNYLEDDEEEKKEDDEEEKMGGSHQTPQTAKKTAGNHPGEKCAPAQRSVSHL